ncbi:Uu.00g084720.m01.CDS01 [Anthostomella pinea]|uniref:Uu.00g084720.m01.CDS01 n=1 Tax=Anthostomella pinea TaxID=933095 RepID=A0AAI8VMR0_9PEZI|nr:Uu.00g084720.m01.CDS01 [Anthostomella pinea]
MSSSVCKTSQVELENEVAELEARLAKAKQQLKSRTAATASAHDENGPSSYKQLLTPPSPLTQTAITDSSQHYLLLLSDSALPLGSFAFSSGLESYLAHARNHNHNHNRTSPAQPSAPSASAPSFSSFLPLSLSSYASTTLPFVLAAHRDPAALAELDDCLDAAVICTVGRRASVAQGRALLSIWEKSFVNSMPSASSPAVEEGARKVLGGFGGLLRRAGGSGSGSGSSMTTTTKPSSAPQTSPAIKAGAIEKHEPHEQDDEEQTEEFPDPDPALPPPASAHLAPLFGAIANILGLSLHQTAYVFMLAHAKALASAAVRAGVFGPYQAQRLLAGSEVQGLIREVVEREWLTKIEEAGQSVPVMDLWVGRHELLYSRIFNS